MFVTLYGHFCINPGNLSIKIFYSVFDEWVLVGVLQKVAYVNVFELKNLTKIPLLFSSDTYCDAVLICWQKPNWVPNSIDKRSICLYEHWSHWSFVGFASKVHISLVSRNASEFAVGFRTYVASWIAINPSIFIVLWKESNLTQQYRRSLVINLHQENSSHYLLNISEFQVLSRKASSSMSELSKLLAGNRSKNVIDACVS